MPFPPAVHTKESIVDATGSAFKVIMVGDYSVGKTTFIDMARRIQGKSMQELERMSDEMRKRQGNYVSTIGVDFSQIIVPIDTQSGTSIKLSLWDTAGQERFASVVQMSLREAHAVIFFHDLTRPETRISLSSRWKSLVQDVNYRILVRSNQDGDPVLPTQDDFDRADSSVAADSPSLNSMFQSSVTPAAFARSRRNSRASPSNISECRALVNFVVANKDDASQVEAIDIIEQRLWASEHGFEAAVQMSSLDPMRVSEFLVSLARRVYDVACAAGNVKGGDDFRLSDAKTLKITRDAKKRANEGIEEGALGCSC